MLDVKNPEETKELIALFKQGKEIADKVEYYKDILRATGDAINSIGKKVEAKGRTETYRVFGIPVTKWVALDGYDIAKLEIEQLELLAELEVKKQYYESWLERKKQYDIKFAELTKECNENYDAVLRDAEAVKAEIPNLKNYMDKYKNENGDQKLKNDYYLFLKYEVDKFKLKKR